MRCSRRLVQQGPAVPKPDRHEALPVWRGGVQIFHVSVAASGPSLAQNYLSSSGGGCQCLGKGIGSTGYLSVEPRSTARLLSPQWTDQTHTAVTSLRCRGL